MAIFRINRNTDYTVMSNVHLRDNNLSLKAKGLMSLMLSLPDKWDYSVNGLTKICKEECTAIESALKELKIYGYLIIKKILPNNSLSGRIEYEYNIYEVPQRVEKQGVEILPIEIQGVENQSQLNTNNKITNNKILNNNNNMKTLMSFVEETEKPNKKIETKETKNEKTIKNLLRYVDLEENYKEYIYRWLQELYDIGKGISKNALILALNYLKEHIPKDEWCCAIEKATISGWRTFEYYKTQQHTSNLNTVNKDNTARKDLEKNINKNPKKFL